MTSTHVAIMPLIASDYTEVSTTVLVASPQVRTQPAVLTDEFVNVVVTVGAYWYTVGEMHWAKRDMPSAFGCNPSGAIDSKTCTEWAVFGELASWCKASAPASNLSLLTQVC